MCWPVQALLSLSLVATPHTVSASGSSSSNPASSNGSTAVAAAAAAPLTAQQQHSDPLLATAAAAAGLKLPSYISLSNMPASHWLPVASLSMLPAPPLPAYPGRRGDGVSAGGGGAGGRPSSQGRRAPVSNLSSAVIQASRCGGREGGAGRGRRGSREAWEIAEECRR